MDYLLWASRESIPFRHFINECVKSRTASQLTAIISPFFSWTNLLKIWLIFRDKDLNNTNRIINGFFSAIARHSSNVNVKAILKSSNEEENKNKKAHFEMKHPVRVKFYRWLKSPIFFYLVRMKNFVINQVCKVLDAKYPAN